MIQYTSYYVEKHGEICVEKGWIMEEKKNSSVDLKRKWGRRLMEVREKCTIELRKRMQGRGMLVEEK